MEISKEELQEIIAQAVMAAQTASIEKPKPESKKLTVEEAKSKSKEVLKSVSDTAFDCVKIAGQGLIGAADEIFTAGIRMILRASGRMA